MRNKWPEINVEKLWRMQVLKHGCTQSERIIAAWEEPVQNIKHGRIIWAYDYRGDDAVSA